MSTIFPDELKTGFYETQRIIALKYVQHIDAKVNSYGDDVVDYIGERDGQNYEGYDGGTRVDYYPYQHMGKTLAMDFELFSEEVRVEFINDINYYVVYVHCQSTNDCISDFMFEFEKDDKELLSLLSEKLINLIKE